MSAILKQTRDLYRKVIKIESLFFVSITLLIMVYDYNKGSSFAFGFFSMFIPQVLLIFFVYFRQKSAQNLNKMTALYQGEGLKFATAIVLIAASFTFYKMMNISFFFSGFVIALLINNLLPIYFRWKINVR